MKLLIPLLMLIMFSSCSPKPRPIEYNSDLCQFCKMTVTDRQHAAQAVSSKGKIYIFDAIECLVPFIESEKPDNYKFLLVNDYLNPGEMIDAKESTFLISENIPSPMGAFLSAFKDLASAKKIQTEKNGDLYTWNDLNKYLKSKE